MKAILQGVAEREPAQGEGQARTHGWDGQAGEVHGARDRSMRGAAAAAESGLATVGEVLLCYGLWGGGDREGHLA